MNQENPPVKGQRRPVSDKFVDPEGAEIPRASVKDFLTLPTRVAEVIANLPEIRQDKILSACMAYAYVSYNAGDYSVALQYLNWSLNRLPTIEPYIFNYIRVCERVLMSAIPPTNEEVEYDANLARFRFLPKWLKWTMPQFAFRHDFRVRCKWCGRLTRYIDPNVSTAGIDYSANSCSSCSRMYPMPSWVWDSPDGRAYSYYRMSFGRDEQFYDEFEQDYDPKPLCQRRQRAQQQRPRRRPRPRSNTSLREARDDL